MELDSSFEKSLSRYEAATVDLVNVAPPGSDVADQAIRNLRECLQLRINLERRRSGQRASRGRRLTDYYPEVDIERHFAGSDRRLPGDRRAAAL